MWLRTFFSTRSSFFFFFFSFRSAFSRTESILPSASGLRYDYGPRLYSQQRVGGFLSRVQVLSFIFPVRWTDWKELDWNGLALLVCVGVPRAWRCKWVKGMTGIFFSWEIRIGLPASAALAGWLGFILEANLATLRKGCDPSMGYGLSTFSDEQDGGL